MFDSAVEALERIEREAWRDLAAVAPRRLADAARRGARFAVTETGVPQPGEPAPSHRNILAAGFRAAYVRPNWAASG